MRLTATFIVLFLFSTSGAHADDPSERKSLRGLNGVLVLVEELQPEVEQNGLTAIAIRTDVELKLRQARIPISDPESIDSPVLHVWVALLSPSDRTLWPYTVRVELRQSAALERDPSIIMRLVSTWSSTPSLGIETKQNVRNLRDVVKDQVDEFINAYLAVNPK
jgi:hypothetical protein